MTFVAKYRKKHFADPFSYPLDHLARTLLLNEFFHTAPSPVGPKTRSDTMRRLAQEQEVTDENLLDLADDTV